MAVTVGASVRYGHGVPTLEVRFHAGLRDLVGSSRTTLLVEPPTRDALFDALRVFEPRLAPYLQRVRLALDDEFADGELALREGSVLDLLPPVAGGSGVVRCAIVETPLSLDALYDAVRHDAAGAVCTFVGVVRDHADGQAVAKLTYEHHPVLAEKELRRVLEGVAGEWPSVTLAAEHRVGPLAIGDKAVVVAASAPHRAEAFEAARAAIDRIKETVPIWKKEEGPALDRWVRFE